MNTLNVQISTFLGINSEKPLLMEYNSTITGLRYQVFLANELEIIKSEDFDINTCPTSCIYSDKKLNFAISKWVSPKHTRSYPYERVYNTLANGKKITVIPVVKDEGFDGDRDLFSGIRFL